MKAIVDVEPATPGFCGGEFSRQGINTQTIPSPVWLNAEKLVTQALADTERGRVISIPSRRYQTLMFLVRHILLRSTVRAVSQNACHRAATDPRPHMDRELRVEGKLIRIGAERCRCVGHIR